MWVRRLGEFRTRHIQRSASLVLCGAFVIDSSPALPPTRLCLLLQVSKPEFDEMSPETTVSLRCVPPWMALSVDDPGSPIAGAPCGPLLFTAPLLCNQCACVYCSRSRSQSLTRCTLKQQYPCIGSLPWTFPPVDGTLGGRPLTQKMK